MDCDWAIKSLSWGDFFRLRLGKDNNREITQNYFEAINTTLSKWAFCVKKYQSSSLLSKEIIDEINRK